MKIRIAKKIAESGITSRRDAERLIESGAVSVNGEKIDTPVFFVDDDDTICVNGKAIPQKSSQIHLWKFYKPRNVIVSRFDPQGRQTVFDVIPHLPERLLYVGRLDYNSEGLLLFTNDGNFSRKLELPKNGLKRIYRARIIGNLRDETVKNLKQNGLELKENGAKIKYNIVDIQKDEKKSKISGANSWLTITLAEGKNREIRKIMEHYSCQVSRLIRIEYGGIKLDSMQPGEFKKCRQDEIKRLWKSISDFKIL